MDIWQINWASIVKFAVVTNMHMSTTLLIIRVSHETYRPTEKLAIIRMLALSVYAFDIMAKTVEKS